MPVAWLPTGTFEWHSFHLPLGFDGVKAEALCVEAARAIGGFVLPTMFYGDNRGQLLEAVHTSSPFPDLAFDHREQVNRELGSDVGRHAAHQVNIDAEIEANRLHPMLTPPPEQ